MEIWDGYWEDGSLANIDLVRGEPIPNGIYHMVCEILVRHTDGDYLLMQRDFRKSNFGGYYEALFEETGIEANSLEEIGRYISSDTIYYQFLCITDCDKTGVSLQEGETVAYRWIPEKEYILFVNSSDMIPIQKVRYADFLKKLGYIH